MCRCADSIGTPSGNYSIIMLHKTRGIVFHITPFSESSVVAKIYTELFGLQSYLINGVRSKKAKIKSGLLQPLSLLDMVVYHKEKGGLQRIREMKQSSDGQFTTIPFDMVKSSMVLFMNEVLYKSVKEEEANPPLFDFIFHSLRLLDLQTPINTVFHLQFLLQLTKYLGFFPNGMYAASTPYFDLQEGTFRAQEPAHFSVIAPPLSAAFDTLINTSLTDATDAGISIAQKRELIEKLIEYYKLHISSFGAIHSNKVLEEVWN